MPDLRRLLADVTPLRESPAYRRLWLGWTLSSIGTAMTRFAVALQVFVITGSSVAVGGVGLAAALPSIVFGLIGGAVVDAFDRRMLVLLSNAGLMSVSALLALQGFLGADSVWLLYVLTAAASVFNAVNGPARRTFMPRLLRAELIPAGAALSMLTMHLSMVAGPLAAGLLVPVAGLKACYAVDAATFLAAMYGTYRLPTMRPEGATRRPGVRAVTEGLAQLVRNRVLGGVLVADMSATLLAMPVALFPAINADRFGGSPRTLGLLSAGLAIGGIVGAAFSGPLRHVHRQGLGVVVSSSVWGAGLVGFGLARGLALTLAFLVIAGIADVISVVLRSTIIQVATPDVFRGRVGAAELIVGAGFPQLGNFRAGVVAEATSPGVSAWSGGVSAIAGAVLVAFAFPALIRYSARADERVDQALRGG